MAATVGLLSGEEQYSHRIWRTEDGLPQNHIQAITQTPDGYLWIGTFGGLARFDGVRFVVFDRSNTPGLPDNSILSLATAQDSSLWIGTDGGGLVQYSHGVFHDFGSADGLTNGFVRAVRAGRDGKLWVGTDRGFFERIGRRFVRLDATPQIPLASVTSIEEDRTGTVWVGASGSLMRVDGGKLTRADCGNGVATRAAAMLFLHAGLTDSGCATPTLPLPELSVSALLRDTLGGVWIGTLGYGLIRSNGGVMTTYRAPSALPDNIISTIFEDKQHNIWVGAQDGLIRFSRTAFSSITERDGLDDADVLSIYGDREGALWMATFSGKVYQLNGMTPKPFALPAPASDARVRTIFEDRSGARWFGTATSGVIRLDHGVATQFTRKDGLRSNSIRQIHQGPDGAIWIATGSGISRWDGRQFTSYYLEQGLSYPSVRCLATDSNGDILAGTDAGLNRIHNGRIVPDHAFEPLKQEKIWAISVDHDEVWLGTRGGGLLLLKQGRPTRITMRNGLISDSIYQILDDRRGRFWMSGPSGLASVSRDELERFAEGKLGAIHAVEYGTPDGMESSQMRGGVQPAGCRTASGMLWFPSVRGVVRIDPDHIPERLGAPVLIERVLAGDTSYPVSKEVIIPPGRGRVEIDFTAPDLIGARRVTFQYKLDGFDEAWTSAGKTRTAYYSNLAPGHYRFRVLATNMAAPATSSEASVAIYWAPRFYQTIWFYTLCAGILCWSTWMGLRIYAQQTRARFALLLAERTRVAREMHDTVIQGCVGISTLLEAAARINRLDPGERTALLDQARAQTKLTLEEARQAVWDLRHYEDGISAIDRLIDFAHGLEREHGIRMEVDVAGSHQVIDPATDRALLLAGREALRNAVRHGHPSRIGIFARREGGALELRITDNGAGFDMDPARADDGHFGIQGMRERIEQVGGVFSLQSRPGEGTIAQMTVPHGAKADSGNALNVMQAREGVTSPQFPGSAPR